MAPQDGVDFMQALRDSRTEFVAAAQGLTDAQASQKPAPGKWSVIDCVEHIVIVEGRVLGRFENPEPVAAPPADPAKEAKIRTAGSNRANPLQAPEPTQPRGRYATLAEAIAAFEAARERTIAFAQQKGADLYMISISHPVFGVLNGVEAMHLAAAHSRRHAEQIKEVRASI